VRVEIELISAQLLGSVVESRVLEKDGTQDGTFRVDGCKLYRFAHAASDVDVFVARGDRTESRYSEPL
jgi:hypothetical protein